MSKEITSMFAEGRTLTTSRKRTRAFATILSASYSGVTIGDLSKRLGVSEKAVTPLVQYMSDAGLLVRKNKGKLSFERSPLGTRVLNTFVGLHRMYGESITRKSAQKSVTYAPCPHCTLHPGYGNLAPVTLHNNGKCVICNN